MTDWWLIRPGRGARWCQITAVACAAVLVVLVLLGHAIADPRNVAIATVAAGVGLALSVGCLTEMLRKRDRVERRVARWGMAAVRRLLFAVELAAAILVAYNLYLLICVPWTTYRP